MEFVFCRLQRVVVPQTVLSRGDQARAAQIGEMPRCRRLWNPQDFHEIPDAEFAIEQQMQNSQARRIGEGAKH